MMGKKGSSSATHSDTGRTGSTDSCVDITIFNAHPRTRLQHRRICDAVHVALHGERVTSITLNIVLVSDDELLAMNRQYLSHDYFTDVISFTLEVEPLEGEIYISVDRAREQAAEHRVPLYHEVMRLAIHGALHIVGYDDTTEDEREQMRSLENRYLAQVTGSGLHRLGR